MFWWDSLGQQFREMGRSLPWQRALTIQAAVSVVDSCVKISLSGQGTSGQMRCLLVANPACLAWRKRFLISQLFIYTSLLPRCCIVSQVLLSQSHPYLNHQSSKIFSDGSSEPDTTYFPVTDPIPCHCSFFTCQVCFRRGATESWGKVIVKYVPI